MKSLVAVLLFSALLFAADKVPFPSEKPRPTSPRWQHIMDKDNKILATIDTKDGSIEYKVKPEEVVRTLLDAYGNLQKNCNNAIANLKKMPEKKK